MSARRTPIVLVLALLATVALPGHARIATPSEHASTGPGAAGAVAGTVEGSVHLEIGAVSEPPVRSPYARRRYRPPARSSSGGGDLRNVAVFVLVDEPGPARSDTTVRIVQRDRSILPHVTVIQTGTTVEFPNEDDVFHNLFSLSGSQPFNLGRYPPGESRTEVFEEPGVIRMFCDIHSNMNAVIRVVDTPHFTRPDEEGAYRIPGVPPGRHRVVAWHETGSADTVEVTVPSAGSVRADLSLDG